jgi:hypothetical protein
MPRSGVGRVYKRGEVWGIDFASGGKRYRESSGSMKKADAVRLLKKRVAEVASGKFIPDAHKVTMGDLFTTLVDKGRAKGNRSTPKLKRLCEWFRTVQQPRLLRRGGVLSVPQCTAERRSQPS